MNEKAYTAKINTPAKNPDYFSRFHKPLVERAKAASPNGEVVLLDIACGHAQELDFFGNDKKVLRIGVDIAKTVLRSAKTRLPETDFIAADVRRLSLRDDSVDVGIALNAVVYVPDKMLEALFRALKPGGRCAVNFRVYGNPFNQPFYDYYLERGGALRDEELVVGNQVFSLAGIDYRGCDDPLIRNLVVQSYFRSAQDAERLISTIGFGICARDIFHFPSPANAENEVDVFTLEKPHP